MEPCVRSLSPHCPPGAVLSVRGKCAERGGPRAGPKLYDYSTTPSSLPPASLLPFSTGPLSTSIFPGLQNLPATRLSFGWQAVPPPWRLAPSHIRFFSSFWNVRHLASRQGVIKAGAFTDAGRELRVVGLRVFCCKTPMPGGSPVRLLRPPLGASYRCPNRIVLWPAGRPSPQFWLRPCALPLLLRHRRCRPRE